MITSDFNSIEGLQTVLVTGATGYVGGRLVPRLLAAGYRVRVLARDAGRLRGREWFDRVQVAQGDALEPGSLSPALQGVSVAYYLIHSGRGPRRGAEEAAERDLRAARTFGAIARAAAVQRIVYLSGLGDPDASLSTLLRSRQDTGEALREGGVPVTEFRAGVVVGPGSASFEIIRDLAERLPVMVCPTWVYSRVQPIALRNVLDYLVAALADGASTGRIIEIGGADVQTFAGMLLEYARIRGLKRWLVPVPVHAAHASAVWVHWVTPVPFEIARPLVDSLRGAVIVRDGAAARLFPGIVPVAYGAAVAEALSQLGEGDVESAWSDALATTHGNVKPVTLTSSDGMMLERRERLVGAPPAAVYRAFTAIGGEHRWPTINWAWWVRGWMDRIVGGVGLRRGRRDSTDLRVGDALDFWRVEALVPNRMVRLRAEMRLPGLAWLQFEAHPDGDGTLFIQTAFFAPHGLFGFLYWYALYPIHGFIFGTMIDALSRRAIALASSTPSRVTA